MLRIELKANVVDFQTERTLVTVATGYGQTETSHFVQRYTTLSVLNATLRGEQKLGEGYL